MSMSVRCAGCGLEYAGQRGPGGLPPGCAGAGGRYLRMLAEVRVPPRRAAGCSLDHGLTPRGRPTTSRRVPRRAASPLLHRPLRAAAGRRGVVLPAGTALRYPARYLFAFLANHGMLSVTGSPPWRTVTGGSRSYVERAAKQLARRPARPAGARGAPLPGGAEVRDAAGEPHRFDAVVIATHPDQALRLLDPPTRGRARGARRVPLHAEPGPAAHRRQPAAAPPARPGVLELPAQPLRGRTHGQRRAISYDMNRLQRLPAGAGLHRHAERARPRRPGPGHRPDGLRAPGLHPGLGRRAAPPARAEHASPRSPAPTTAGVSTRTAAGPAPQAARALGGTW